MENRSGNKLLRKWWYVQANVAFACACLMCFQSPPFHWRKEEIQIATFIPFLSLVPPYSMNGAFCIQNNSVCLWPATKLKLELNGIWCTLKRQSTSKSSVCLDIPSFPQNVVLCRYVITDQKWIFSTDLFRREHKIHEATIGRPPRLQTITRCMCKDSTYFSPNFSWYTIGSSPLFSDTHWHFLSKIFSLQIINMFFF